jgi:hypothetical protein
MLPAPTRVHLHAAASGGPLDFAQEPRLADARLAGDQDELRLSAAGVVQVLLEPFPLAVSVDERTCARGLLPDHSTPHFCGPQREG